MEIYFSIIRTLVDFCADPHLISGHGVVPVEGLVPAGWLVSCHRYMGGTEYRQEGWVRTDSEN